MPDSRAAASPSEPSLQLDAESDQTLIERARSGDKFAFDELVQRHRMKAFTWASRISKDPHLSEDIVQEALIRAFLNLNTLAHDQRFVGWFKAIVRNQALMRIRRGGQYGKEMPLTAWQQSNQQQAIVNVNDINSIMDFLIARSHSSAQRSVGEDPQLRLERQEWYNVIRAFLHVLTPKEKRIFESYFFQECSPQEIAELFEISVGNVYKVISRSRRKVQEERLSFLIRAHIRQRKEDGFMKRNRLDPAPLQVAGGSILSGTENLYRFVRARHPQLSLAYVDGFLTGAFLLNLEKSRIDMSSTNMIDRNYLITNGMLNLGMRVRYAEAFDFEPPDPNLLTRSLALVQDSVDAGVPAMVWELINSEFGMIYGYDDASQQFDGIDSQSEAKVAYDRLGRLQTRSLFVLGFIGDELMSRSDALWRLCRMVSKHARGGDQTFAGYANGLAAYDTWISVFREKAIEPLGHAYTIEVLREGRKHASLCLQELASEWRQHGTPTSVHSQEIISLLEQAAAQYSNVFEGLCNLAALFPSPTGGEPTDPKAAAQAISVLETMQTAERIGVQTLERIAEQLEQHSSRTHVPAIVTDPFRAYYM
ncbi:RNA polymerase sigma factor (sigma-70 family) [Paenibacillus cellulosilyticus]|uniref:RNA polymerase sigma factor (Sigma-70 family) n=1 Tax=Paenibacillus cellulosilyticus TaxID=375489 RepID=A0A2V2YUM3_9BACL|nr:sigma-70 family RNA polymerase sigma factor [Paenibacillus cellulosilyticus]PWW04795.1 RNA polymerase sigma factor (sigma-70 family) [Paenibacillus cellulosilyticus]QKS45916.1 sigma-70 family RNA polymerase sigma factor [Paenibacillus cellulosilyticus]